MRNHRYVQGLALATLVASALHAGAAAAQPICIAPPNHVPGSGAEALTGPPTWFAGTGDPSVDASVPRAKWLNDVRWADAGRARLGDAKDDAAYRVLYDNGYLIVSIQTQ